jgi:uncharacterized protein
VAIIVIGLIMLVYMYLKAHTDHVEIKKIIDPHFPSADEELSIFFISDIHKRKIKDETINKVQSVNVTIIGGDLCEKGVSFLQVKENINKLKALGAPIYFVWGNNDYEVHYRDLDALLLENGVRILADSSVEFELNNGRTISFVGLDSDTYKEVNPFDAFEQAKSDYVLLATHDPNTFELLNEQQKKQVNLVVSGHTHGGQIRLFRLGLYSRGGWKKKGHAYFLVSEGYGTTKLPLRLGTNAECHKIIVQKR